MAPIAKEPDLQNSASPATTPNPTQPKVQPVALEISVTVNGARSVEGSDKREPFSETTQTVLVFGNGAVIRLNSSVAPGQLLFLTNEKTKKEVVCQVVKSKNYRSVSGYVELEFTEPAVGFWGMRFPADKIGSGSTQTSVAPTPVAPAKPAPVTVSGDVKPALPSQQANPVVIPPPVSIAPPISVAPPPTTVPANVAPLASANNASEDLKKETARLQEQLSSLLFSETPASKPAAPAPQVDPAAISDAAAKILEISKAEPPASQPRLEPVQSAPATKTFEPLNLTPIVPKQRATSSLHEEEVKIPSWLEPLARNAAAPTPTATQQSAPPLPVSLPSTFNEVDEVDSQLAGESYDFPSKTESAVAPAIQVETPNFGSNLFETSEAAPAEPATSGSKKGLWIGAIAATVLLAAGAGYWYTQQSGHAAASTTAAPISQPVTQPASLQQAAQSPSSTPVPQTGKAFSTPSPAISQPSNTANVTVTPATEVQKIPAGHESSKSTPTSAATRAAEPVEETRKSTFSQIRLAAPTVKGGNGGSVSNENEPGIALENSSAPTGSALGSALAGSHNNQPAVPIPVGGEVKPAQLISSVPPVYPTIARSQRLAGDVKIDALIDEHGRVTSMKVLSGPVMLYQAAQDSLRQWKYRPATLNGEPQSTHLLVTIQFRLQ